MEKKIQYFQAEFKEIEVKSDRIKIKGLASTPTIDRYSDIVNPIAFKNSIESYMKNPVILLQHDSDDIIGKAIDYKINFKGLEIEAEIINDIENVIENIKNGLLKGFSIGFIPLKWAYRMEGEKEVREIMELDLIEISVVSTPANKESLFTLSKSIKSFFNNLQNENMKKEIKEEIIEEVIVKEEEIIVEKEEIIEGSDNTKTLDEVEKASENLDVVEEIITEEVETVPTEVIINETKNKANEEVKEIDLLKNEIKELKSSIDGIVEILETTIKNQTEIKLMVNKIPVRKGLITNGLIETKSSLSTQIDSIRKQNFII